MLHTGENIVGGVPVEVVRKRVRRISIRVSADGRVTVSLPRWFATLRDAEEFLVSKWSWVVKTREKALANPPPALHAPTAGLEILSLQALLQTLNAKWSAALGEPGVRWRLRRMKTLWGSCHWRRRVITYNTELAFMADDLVEYVVVHEFTHFAAHDHGAAFQRLMDERLPGWRELRRRLNKRGKM